MDLIDRRSALRWLLAGGTTLAACDLRRQPDNRRQAWTVLIDLSGTAVADRRFYVRELQTFVTEIASLKPSVIVNLVGFSGFVKPFVSGQAQLLAGEMGATVEAITKWPLDPHTDLGAALSVAYDLDRKRNVERRVIWCLSDGVHDPLNRWRTRPTFPVPLPKTIPLDAMREANTTVHWDTLDEYQLSTWQRLFEDAGIPAALHLRGYLETARARVQRLPAQMNEPDGDRPKSGTDLARPKDPQTRDNDPERRR